MNLDSLVAGQFASVRDSVMQGLLALLGGALLVLLVLFWLADRSIRQPLQQLRADMRNIAQSLQLNQPVSAQGRDEVADAARAFNQLLDAMRGAYAHAIASGYRFYSYGDASLLWRAN